MDPTQGHWGSEGLTHSLQALLCSPFLDSSVWIMVLGNSPEGAAGMAQSNCSLSI